MDSTGQHVICSDEELHLKGAHGTARSWAEQIEEQGFIHSPKGWYGPGVYFFRGATQYAIELASCFQDESCKKGSYKNCRDQSCCVILVDIFVKTSNYFNCSEHAFRQCVYDLIQANPDFRQWKRTTEIMMAFIKRLEKETQKAIHVIEMLCPAPKSFKQKYLDYNVTFASSYLVRNKDCIHVCKVVECFNEQAN